MNQAQNAMAVLSRSYTLDVSPEWVRRWTQLGIPLRLSGMNMFQRYNFDGAYYTGQALGFTYLTPAAAGKMNPYGFTGSWSSGSLLLSVSGWQPFPDGIDNPIVGGSMRPGGVGTIYYQAFAQTPGLGALLQFGITDWPSNPGIVRCHYRQIWPGYRSGPPYIVDIPIVTVP